MTRKTFAAATIAGLAGIAALASGMRSNPQPASAAQQVAAGPSVETIVEQRTKVVRRHVHKRARVKSSGPSPRSSGSQSTVASSSGVGSSNAGPGSINSGREAESEDRAPRPTTSPSGTGSDDDHYEARGDDDGGDHGEDHGDDDGGEHEDD